MWSSTPLLAFVIVFELLSNSEGFLFLVKGCLCSGSGEQRISGVILGPKVSPNPPQTLMMVQMEQGNWLPWLFSLTSKYL